MLAFLTLFPLFMIAVTVHEVSHGVMALRLGDPTAKIAGRLTLNPLKHIDPIGTVALPLLLLFLKAPVFGWARPVPINPAFLHHPKRDLLWVGAAGPAANFTLAALAAAVLQWTESLLPAWGSGALRYLVVINLVLGTFNLLPIPPLDGSRILTSLLPARYARYLLVLEQWGFVVVMLLLYAGVIDRFIWPAVSFLIELLGVR